MNEQAVEWEAAVPDSRWLYLAAGISALLLVLGYLATFPLYAAVGVPPVGTEARLSHYGGNLAGWWAILWLMVSTDFLFVFAWVGVYRALEPFDRDLGFLALALMGLFLVLDLSVTWPNHAALLQFSAGYIAADSTSAKAALVAAASGPSALLHSPLASIYSIVVPAMGALLGGVAILRSRVFSRMTGYIGLAVGVTGVMAVAGPYVSSVFDLMHVPNALLMMVMFLLLGLRLLKLAKAQPTASA